MTIELVPITRDNWRDTLELSVTPNQQRFVADHEPIALVGLAKAYVRPDRRLWLPFAFHDSEKIVGFVELVVEAHSPAEAWIFHFFIDRRYQGDGLGGQSLQALIKFVISFFPSCRQICLTVHPDNVRARHLYQAAGFVEVGTMLHNEPVLCLKLG